MANPTVKKNDYRIFPQVIVSNQQDYEQLRQ